MTLGEFRKQTAELPDDAELVVLNVFNDETYGKSADGLQIISAKDISEKFLLNRKEDEKNMNLSKPLVLIKGDHFDSQYDPDLFISSL